MSRPRVLCVSADRSTRASVTLSLTDEPVNVVVARDSDDATARLQHEPIDAVVIDASTVTDVPALIGVAESNVPQTPTFVHWGHTTGDDSAAVLTEVIARTDEPRASNRLAEAVLSRLETALDDATRAGRPLDRERDETGTETGTDSGIGADDDATAPDAATQTSDSIDPELERIIDAVNRRLVDVTSPIAVERVLREEFTASDRFAFAWVGEYDRGEREIVPWLTDPSATAWSMQRTFSVNHEDVTDESLLGCALNERELQIVDPQADAAVPLGEHASERDVRAVAAAPLGTADELYGVFVVYALADLTPDEQDTIRAVADTASHVLESIAVRGQLEQQERILQRYERLVETAGDGMYVFDEDGNFMTVNDALVEMTGYTREGLLGEYATFLFDEDDVAAGEDVIRSLLRSGDHTDTLELILETKTGETIPCEIQIAVLVYGGEFHGSVGVVRDVTERKRQERKLRERNERLDAFARIVSHDLRNPLGVAQGYLDLIDQTGSTDHVANVRDGLDRMEAIIDDVLAIARGGEWAAETDAVGLDAVATEAWEHVSTADASLEIVASADLRADRSRLLRLLENCFRNSIEHGGDSVTIRIGTLPNERGFFVADDGVGLPDDISDDVFDPSVSTSSEGLGIGLWVVREVATGHGWSVGATESEDGGARFEFAFEAADTEAGADAGTENDTENTTEADSETETETGADD